MSIHILLVFSPLGIKQKRETENKMNEIIERFASFRLAI